MYPVNFIKSKIMIKYFFLILSFLILTNCHSSKLLSGRSECQEFYNYVKSNWSKNKDYTFRIKGNPDYWRSEIHENLFKESCILKLSKKQIIELFGEPSKRYVFPESELFIYCLTRDCLSTLQASRRELVVTFDSSNSVVSIVTSPPSQVLEN